jgi:hypothetical protein
LVEWPGILENELPEEAVRLYFETIDTFTRKLEVKING